MSEKDITVSINSARQAATALHESAKARVNEEMSKGTKGSPVAVAAFMQQAKRTEVLMTALQNVIRANSNLEKQFPYVPVVKTEAKATVKA